LTLAGGAWRDTLVLLVLLACLPAADGSHPGRSGGGCSAARPSTLKPLQLEDEGLQRHQHRHWPRLSLSLRGGASIEDDDEVERAVEDDLSLESSMASGCDPKRETRNPKTYTRGTSLGGVPREQKKLKGHLPRDIYHQVYYYTKN